MLERTDDDGLFQHFYEAMKSDKRFTIFSMANFVSIDFKIAYKWEGRSIYMNDVGVECEDGVLRTHWHKGMKTYRSTFDISNYDIRNMKKLLDDYLDSIPPIADQKNRVAILNNEKASVEEKLKALEGIPIERAFFDEFDKFSKQKADFILFVEDAAALANLSLEEFYAALFLK